MIKFGAGEPMGSQTLVLKLLPLKTYTLALENPYSCPCEPMLDGWDERRAMSYGERADHFVDKPILLESSRRVRLPISMRRCEALIACMQPGCIHNKSLHLAYSQSLTYSRLSSFNPLPISLPYHRDQPKVPSSLAW